jgi:hypothetical protein
VNKMVGFIVAGKKGPVKISGCGGLTDTKPAANPYTGQLTLPLLLVSIGYCLLRRSLHILLYRYLAICQWLFVLGPGRITESGSHDPPFGMPRLQSKLSCNKGGIYLSTGIQDTPDK